MNLKGFELKDRWVELTTDVGSVSLFIWGAGIIRCVHTRRELVDYSPLEISPPAGGSFSWQVAETPDLLTLTGGGITLEIAKANCRFSWGDKNGNLLVKEVGKELTPKDVIKYSTGDEPPIIEKIKTVDGERNWVTNLAPYIDRQAYSAKLKFCWQEGESIHGLGQGEEGIYNYRGNVQYLYQHNMRIPMPSFVSSMGYGVVFDCGSTMTYNDDSRGSYFYLDTVEQLDYYFIAADKLDGIIAGFRQLTGRAELLPKWGYGYIQSKEAYHDQDELVAVGERYRQLGVPIDCVVQDWNTWLPGRWGDKRVDKSRYPNLSEANARLHQLDIHTMVSVWPNLSADSEDYTETRDAGLLLGDASTYDAFSEAGRALYWKQAERELFSGGFDSWWCDSTEPFPSPDWGGEFYREPWERYLLVGGEHKKYLDSAQANLYALKHAQGMYENQNKATGKAKRVLNLTRSGYLGSQKYGTVLWSGDIVGTWEEMKAQIAEGLNMGMSGVPWWTLDIGGFFVVHNNWQGRGCGNNTNPAPIWFWQGGFEGGVADLGYRELYTRWLQYGVFLPMFRSHGTDTPREIWNFGEPGEPFYDTIESYIKLRYQLMPYIYSVAGMVTHKDYTFMRGLIFDFPHDQRAVCEATQFMCGPSIMVCPVTAPMYFGADSRELEAEKRWSCYLPESVGWYDFWSGSYYNGGQEITVPAPLDKTPLFIKAGGIIPMENSLDFADQQVDTPLELRVYSGADGEFSLYEDDGDNYGYQQGEYNFIPLRWQDSSRTLTVGSGEHRFNGSAAGRRLKILLYSGKTVSETQFEYTGKEITVKID